MNLNDKIAIITGGASGIGAGCAQKLAEKGACVAITDINVAAGEAFAKELRQQGFKAGFYQHDVTSKENWQDVIAAVTKDFGGFNVLVNNAGAVSNFDIENIELELWDRIVTLNQTSVMVGTQLAIRYMKNNGGGSIINMSSIYGINGDCEDIAYSATKGAVRLLSKSAAIYCGRQNYNIRVNSMHPGFVKTPLVVEAFKELPAELEQQLIAAHPIGRFGEVEEIANGVAFLASDESSFMTGSELIIDGGFTAL